MMNFNENRLGLYLIIAISLLLCVSSRVQEPITGQINNYINPQGSDWRNIDNALSIIPDENYADQPYVVIAKNGDWVCVLTTGPGAESRGSCQTPLLAARLHHRRDSVPVPGPSVKNGRNLFYRTALWRTADCFIVPALKRGF